MVCAIRTIARDIIEEHERIMSGKILSSAGDGTTPGHIFLIGLPPDAGIVEERDEVICGREAM